MSPRPEWSRTWPDRMEAVVVASECDLYGHDYQVREADLDRVIDRAARVPDSVFCGQCGLSWKVERG